MADPKPEVLSIEIKYNDNHAGDKIAALRKNVEGLNSALSGSSMTNLKNFSDTMANLGRSVGSLKSVGTTFNNVANATTNLFNTFRSFNARAYSSQISSMSKALGQVGSALGSFTQNGKGLSSLVSGISQVPKAISAFGQVDYQKIGDIRNVLNQLGDATSYAAKQGNGLNNLRMGLERLPAALSQFNKATTKAMTGGLFSKGTIGNVGKVVSGLAKQMEKLDTRGISAISRLATGLEKLSTLAQDPNLTDKLSAIAKQIATFAQTVTSSISEDVLSKFERLGAAMAGLGSGPKGVSIGGLAKGAGKASSLFGDLGKNMMTVIRLATKISKLPFKMVLSPLQSIGKGLMDMTDKFTGFLRRIGNVALYRAVRSGIKMVTSSVKDGVNHLYEWATIVGDSFTKTMDTLATAVNYTVNSIGAAASPILDAIAPVFDAIADKFVSVLNIFNQLIASLTGASTWRRAEKVASTYADTLGLAGDSADDADDKIKELKRTILGFDEINKLNDALNDSTNGSKGKAGDSDSNITSLTFSEQPISSAVSNFADKLKDAWEKADFTEIGTILGEKIGKALSNIPWKEKIQPAVVKLAQSFGTLLNGMFDYNGPGGKAMWDGIAYTIYNAINTAVLGYVTFFKTVNWSGIGEGIGAALKKVIQNIDWDLVAEALAAFPNAVIDAVTGFCKQFTTDDFYEVGKHIGETISKALTLIDWSGLFGNAVTIATGVLAALNGALENFDWKGVKDAILKGLKSISSDQWKKLGSEFGKAVFNVLTFGAKLADTLISALEKIKWGDLLKGLKDGINAWAKKQGGWKKVASNIGDWFGKHIGTLSIMLAIGIGISALKNLAGKLLTGALFGSMVTKAPLVGGGTLATLGTVPAFIAACAITIPIALTLVPKIMESVDDLVKKFVDYMDPIINPTVDKVVDVITNRNYKPNNIYTGGATAGEKGAPSSTTYKRDLGNGASVWQMPSGDLNLDNIDIDKALEAARKRFAEAEPIKIPATVDTSNPSSWWKKVSKAWSDFTSGKTVKEFLTKGIQNDSSSWWGNLSKWWQKIVDKNAADKFRTEGIVDPTKSAWENVKTWWKRITDTNKVAKYQSAGIVNNTQTAWNNIVTWWRNHSNSKRVDKYQSAGIINNTQTAWNNIVEWWRGHTSTKTVGKYQSAGIVDNTVTAWNNIFGWWKSIVDTHQVNRFSSAGIVNNTVDAWNNIFAWWKGITDNHYVNRFTSAGIVNNTVTAWNDISDWWSNIVDNHEVNRFRTAGIQNEGYSWWSQAKKYWGEATSSSTLTAKVSIGNIYDAFVNAYNAIQGYFNSNTLTASVQVQGAAATVSTGAAASSKNNNKDKKDKAKKKADGGIFKNGEWHSIREFAAGGLPDSGQMFIAREAGPELVGSIGNSTAVLNNDQIVNMVAAGVKQAVSEAMGNGQTNEIIVKVDSETLYRAVRKGERKASGRYSTSVAVG